MIARFSGEYRWLSNFYPCQVALDGLWYPSVEHAYQAAKTEDSRLRELITQLDGAGAAKLFGQRVLRREDMRPDWFEVREQVMLALLRQKFERGGELAAELLRTRGELVEGNRWHDVYWGVCHCARHHGCGRNRLGELIMQVRAELRLEK